MSAYQLDKAKAIKGQELMLKKKTTTILKEIYSYFLLNLLSLYLYLICKMFLHLWHLTKEKKDSEQMIYASTLDIVTRRVVN